MSKEQITLGEAISKLKSLVDVCGGDTQVVFDFCNMVPTTLDSWRGVYSELALGYEYGGARTVGELLEIFESALGSTFSGYKGGDSVMTADTTLWVANYGNSGSTVIVDITHGGYEIVIHTDYQPF